MHINLGGVDACLGGWITALQVEDFTNSAFGSAAAQSMRASAIQVEILRRVRNNGHLFVRVEHVHINEGGQAVIGNVKKGECNRFEPLVRLAHPTRLIARWSEDIAIP